MTGGVVAKQVEAFLGNMQASGVLTEQVGTAVALVENGELRYCGGHGWRDRSRRLPVTPHTVFDICSFTKLFTATAFELAASDGKLALDIPINQGAERLVFSDARVSEMVTVTDVLSHRTGLPANDMLWYLGAVSRAQLFSSIRYLELLPDSFRKTFCYNNLLYGALGYLFEDLVGEPWTRFVAERILRPLGMTSTKFALDADEQDVALPYAGERELRRPDATAVLAGGGMRSTISDLARWLEFQLAGGVLPNGQRLVSADAITRMRTPHAAAKEVNPVLFSGLEWVATDASYGLGWFMSEVNGEQVLFHPGLIDGLSLAIVLVPGKRSGGIVLMNTNLSGAPGQLLQELLGHHLRAEPAIPPAPIVPARGLAGEYVHPAYGPIRIQQTGDGYTALYGGHTWPLVFRDATTADLPLDALGMTMPLPAQFSMNGATVTALSVPLTLDPRLAPLVFARASN